MQLDPERVFSKIAFIREQTTAIEDLIKNKEKDEIINDPWLLRGLKYALQTAIEAVIDICYHISAKQFKHAPTEARDALEVLKEYNVISSQEFKIISVMIGFRNRLVHGYQKVSAEKVYGLAAYELNDFERFIKSILRFLKNTEDK